METECAHPEGYPLIPMCDDNDKNYQTKETARGFISLTEKLETDILLEVWSCIMERFHKTSHALQGQQNNFE